MRTEQLRDHLDRVVCHKSCGAKHGRRTAMSSVLLFCSWSCKDKIKSRSSEQDTSLLARPRKLAGPMR